jgi:hypothetical protein
MALLVNKLIWENRQLNTPTLVTNRMQKGVLSMWLHRYSISNRGLGINCHYITFQHRRGCASVLQNKVGLRSTVNQSMSHQLAPMMAADLQDPGVRAELDDHLTALPRFVELQNPDEIELQEMKQFDDQRELYEDNRTRVGNVAKKGFSPDPALVERLNRYRLALKEFARNPTPGQATLMREMKAKYAKAVSEFTAQRDLFDTLKSLHSITAD